MTRLRTSDIEHIVGSLAAYDRELLRKTGRTLRGVACHAAGADEDSTAEMLGQMQARVIPVTTGEGLIRGFSEAVAAIVSHIGMETTITQKTNVAGLAEAVGNGADVVFLSDDDDFVVLHLRTRRVCHNSEATAAGFVAALDLMAGGMSGRKALVIGCGAVGSAAAVEVINRGGIVSLFDTDSERSTGAAVELRGAFETEVRVCANLPTALAEHELLIEATDSAGVIGSAAVSAESWIAALGMPLGLTCDAATKAFDRMIHDPLQIGVATMAVESVKGLS